MTIKGRVIVCPGVFMNVFVYVKAASLRGSGDRIKRIMIDAVGSSG